MTDVKARIRQPLWRREEVWHIHQPLLVPSDSQAFPSLPVELQHQLRLSSLPLQPPHSSCWAPCCSLPRDCQRMQGARWSGVPDQLEGGICPSKLGSQGMPTGSLSERAAELQTPFIPGTAQNYRIEIKTTPPQKYIHTHDILPGREFLIPPNASFKR